MLTVPSGMWLVILQDAERTHSSLALGARFCWMCNWAELSQLFDQLTSGTSSDSPCFDFGSGLNGFPLICVEESGMQPDWVWCGEIELALQL